MDSKHFQIVLPLKSPETQYRQGFQRTSLLNIKTVVKLFKMKKLKLSSLQIGAKELLTREQMKAVYGGSGDEGGSGIGNFKCRCENGATASVSPCTVTGSGWDACEWFCQDKGGVDGCGFW